MAEAVHARMQIQLRIAPEGHCIVEAFPQPGKDWRQPDFFPPGLLHRGATILHGSRHGLLINQVFRGCCKDVG
jgi:hypothetical protein